MSVTDSSALIQQALHKIQSDLGQTSPVFPTGLRVAVAIRKATEDPDCQLADLLALVRTEPLIVSKVLRVANSVAFNPRGFVQFSLDQAVPRIGFTLLRSISLAVSLTQLQQAQEVRAIQPVFDAIWRDSVRLAAVAPVVARALNYDDPDEALLAGLVSRLGAFSLLYELGCLGVEGVDVEALLALVQQHEVAVAGWVLKALALPAEVVLAVSPESAPSFARARLLHQVLAESRAAVRDARLGQDGAWTMTLKSAEVRINQIEEALLLG